MRPRHSLRNPAEQAQLSAAIVGRRPTPSSAFRARHFLLAALCASLGALLLTAAPALASITHLYDSTTTGNFGYTPGTIGVGIDQTSGDVYAAELNGNSVQKFNAAGEPVSSFGGGTGAISLAVGVWGIAVDQTSHDFYVTTESQDQVYKFDSQGNPVASFGTGGQLSVNRSIGVAVNPTNGDLYVASLGENEVKVFTSSGAPVTEFSAGPVSPLGVAVDASGHVYVAGGGYVGGGAGLERFSETGIPEGTVQAGGFQGVAVDPASQDIYTSQAGEIAQYSPGAESVISNFGAGIVNDAWGVAINEHTGDVYVGTFSGSAVDAFGPAVILADVTTDPPTPANVGHKAATLTGKVDPVGGPEVTECDIEYGTNTEYLSGKVPCETATPITTAKDVSAKLTGLTPTSTYHYRFVVKNENSLSYGQDQTVEAVAVIEVETGSATNITANEAKLNGSFQIDPEGGETQYYFEWGLTNAYGNKTSQLSDSTSGAQVVSTVIENLGNYTPYHYRIVASNSLGTTYGLDQYFYTKPPNLPSIDSTASSGVSPEGATLESEVNPGLGPTVVRFEYGPSSSYGFKTPPGESIGDDDIDHAVSSSVTGLLPGTAYHYRVLAVNFAGVVAGPDRTFNTTDLPTVSATAASAVSPTTAMLSAQVKPGFSPTTYHFEYGIGVSYGQRTPESASIGSDNSVHAESTVITALAPATTYHYRIVATNEIGTTDGPDQIFTTASPVEEKKVGPPTCKKGRVLMHGKCVKKPRRKPRHHKRAEHNQGGKR